MSAQRSNLSVWLLFCSLSVLGLASVCAQATLTEEYTLKAALVYKLARFVEWPSGELQGRFRICVLGQDPFGSALDVLEARELKALPIEIWRGRQLDVAIAGCGILFITKGAAKDMKTLLPALEDRPVLTIGDTEDFAARGGMMQMPLKSKKIRFTINLQSAEDAGLKVAAPLLELSKVIRPMDKEKVE